MRQAVAESQTLQLCAQQEKAIVLLRPGQDWGFRYVHCVCSDPDTNNRGCILLSLLSKSILGVTLFPCTLRRSRDSSPRMDYSWSMPQQYVGTENGPSACTRGTEAQGRDKDALTSPHQALQNCSCTPVCDCCACSGNSEFGGCWQRVLSRQLQSCSQDDLCLL